MTNKNFCLPIANIPTNDSEEDVKVSIYHDNGSVLHLILNVDRQPTVFIQSDARAKRSKTYFKECFPEAIIVVPTLGQFEETEKPNDPDYVRSVEHTRLAARNFRNIWRQKNHSDFQEFSALVEGN